MENLARPHVLELARMAGEHLGGAGRERRIDEHRRVRNASLVDQRRQVEEQLLRAFERKDRDDEVAAAGERGLDLGLEQGPALLNGDRVAEAIAIGAFANDMVDPGGRLRIGMEALVGGAEIAGKEQSDSVDLDLDRCRAEDVAGVPETRAEAGRGFEPLAQRHAARIFIGRDRVRLGVDRLDRRLIGPVGTPVAAFGFAFLDPAGIGQHMVEQIAGGRRAIDRASIALCDEPRQKAAMIDMGVA